MAKAGDPARARRFKKARELTGLTQKQVAEERNANVSGSTMQRAERGERLDEVSLMRLATFYKVDPAWLLTGETGDDESRLVLDARAISPDLDAFAHRKGMTREAVINRALSVLRAAEGPDVVVPGSTPLDTSLKPHQRKRPVPRRQPTSGG